MDGHEPVGIRGDISRCALRKRPVVAVLVTVAAMAAASGCRDVPITGRKQFVPIPEQQEVMLGENAYREIVTTEPLSNNARYIEMVERVGQRIAAVSGRPDYQWEFRVIATPEQNAFCLPGGKVVFHEGILPVCRNEAGIAVVMSHEIAHALARHGGERMAQQGVSETVRLALQAGTHDFDAHDREMILGAYGAASELGVILPYSRKHESEADHMGLMLMARAGYDPAEAPRFWERFAASHGGTQPNEFLSTHPSDARRADDLRALLPEAQALYAQAPTKHGLGETLYAENDRPASMAVRPAGFATPAATDPRFDVPNSRHPAREPDWRSR